jgi:hypothetical protein
MILPYVTPQLMLTKFDYVPLTLTNCFRPVKQFNSGYSHRLVNDIKYR